MNVQTQQPTFNTRNDGAFRFLGIPTLIRAAGEATNGSFGLSESWDMAPGWASPYHTHHNEDESFYVLEGEMAFVCDGKWMKGGPGTFVYGPRELAHGFVVVGDKPARMLLMCNPGGFEHFILGQATDISAPAGPPDMQLLMELAAKFHIDIHGPLPAMPDGFAEVAVSAEV